MDYSRVRLFFLLINMAILFLSPAYGVAVVDRDFDEILDRSDEVLYGLVTDIHSGYEVNEHGRSIFSYIQFSELRAVKELGSQNANPYVLRIAGGRVGDTIQMFPGMPQFEIGKRYIIFVRDNTKVAFPLVGIQQGFIAVDNNPTNGRHTLVFNKSTEKIKTRFSLIKRELNLGVDDGNIDSDDFISVLREYWNIRKFRIKATETP